MSRCKVHVRNAPDGHFTKSDFAVVLATRSVTCPAGQIAPLRGSDGACGPPSGRPAPLVARCAVSPEGRTTTVGPHEALLARAGGAARPGLAGRLPGHLAAGRAQDRPSHAPARWGRRARLRSRPKVGADFALAAAAAMSLARLAVLGLIRSGSPRSSRTG